jgi:NTP pyrophosphatase (non-canonical NTP hydrolase)
VNLAEFQLEVSEWSNRNFGEDSPSWQRLLGLSHSYLKREQGIRLEEDHNKQIRDAVGDIMVYLSDFCGREGVSLERCVEEAWQEVKQRDWNKHRKEFKTS